MKKVFIFGGGAVGIALAVHLARSDRSVVLVRTSGIEFEETRVQLSVDDRGTLYRAVVTSRHINQLGKIDGLCVITAKAFANRNISNALVFAQVTEPVVLLQNGLGVERPFLDAGFQNVYRAVLYVSGQREANNEASLHAIKPSVVGVIRGTDEGLASCVGIINSVAIPFESTPNIECSVWKKTVVNCVFNSICPLLEMDNGLFARDPSCLELARQVVRECMDVAKRLGVILDEQSVIDQIHEISSRSNHLISTLQDIRNGRPTEIEFLNLEVSRIAAALDPQMAVPRTESLGKLIAIKSASSM